MKSSLAAVPILAVVLLAVVVVSLMGASQTSTTATSSAESSLSTHSTETSTTTYTTFALSHGNGSTGPGPRVSEAQIWNLNIGGYAYPPNFVSFNPNASEIYLSGAGGPSNVVTVVDSNTHNVTGTFSIPGTTYVGPISVDSQADSLLAFADTCEGEPNANSATCPPGSVHPGLFELNESTMAVIRQFSPSGIGYATNLEEGTLYVTQTCPNPHGVPMNPDLPNCGFLNTYDFRSGALLANVSLNGPPYGIAVDAKTNMIYVVTGSTFAGFSEEFVMINGTNNQVVSKTPFDTISTPVLHVDTSTDTVFALATNQSSTILIAVDGSDGRILYSSPIGSACSVDSNRYYVNSVTDQVYASGSNDTSGTNYFLVLNASNGRLVNMISTGGNAYEDSTFNPKLDQVYLLAGNQLMALPANTTNAYVNPSLLTHSNCMDVPV